MSNWQAQPPGPQGPHKPIDTSVKVLVGLLVLGFLIYYAVKGRSGQEAAISRLMFFGVLIPSVILHEVSHGAMALVFGDRTALNQGRLSLNPLRHVDPFGTIILPAILIISTSLAFGYAKPVPVNTAHMSRNKAMLVGLIGPVTNIVLALIAAAAIHVVIHLPWFRLYEFVLQLGLANVVLAAFNLIPVPPLDGSSVIERFLPNRYWPQYLKVRQYSMFALFILVFMTGNFLNGLVFEPAIRLWAHTLPS